MSRVRTDLNCTECNATFIAQLDFSIDGNHIVECPYCGHEHCRVIKNGKVTGDRWSTRDQRIDVERKHIWKSDSLPMATSTAGEFLRQRWLNLVQFGAEGDVIKNMEELSGDSIK
jgi:DNA-directed RNA polymerase subunit RPC12/RpoP